MADHLGQCELSWASRAERRLGTWLRCLVESTTSGQKLRNPTVQQTMVQFMGAAASATYKRRLFFTQEGYIGLAPKGAKVGDKISALWRRGPLRAAQEGR